MVVVFLMSIFTWIFVGGACSYRLFIANERNFLVRTGFILSCLYPIFMPILLNKISTFEIIFLR
jgi:hypothetical protein